MPAIPGMIATAEIRESMTRPATPTRWPVAVSGARSGWAARTSAIVAVRPNPAG